VHAAHGWHTVNAIAERNGMRARIINHPTATTPTLTVKMPDGSLELTLGPMGVDGAWLILEKINAHDELVELLGLARSWVHRGHLADRIDRLLARVAP
jgi:hypothetical protein